MGLTAKSGLFELVNTLTTSEKRYLKQFINKSGESKSNHAKLFEVLAKQEVYNEEKVRKKFKGTSIDKQWSRVKNYLYNYILRILQSYYQQDVEFDVSNMLQQVAILYRKGIYDEASKLLMKVKYLAFEGSSPTLLPFIADWEMRLGRFRYSSEGKYPLDYDENNKWAVDVAANLLLYNKSRLDVTENKFKKGRLVHMEKGNLDVLNSDMYASIEQAQSPMAKWSFYNAMITLHTQRAEYLEAYCSSKKCLELHKKVPLLQKQAPLCYVTTINHLIINGIELKKWGDIPLILKEIEPFIQKNKTSSIGILLTSIKYIALLKRCIGTMEYKEGLSYEKEVKQFIKNYSTTTPVYVQEHLLLHYLIHIYVVNGKFKDALEAIERVEKIQQIPVYLTAILLLKLICLFEQNEVLLLPYVIRSIYRALLKKKDLFEFERIILNLLKTSVNAASRDELQVVFHKYWIKLKSFKEQALEVELELLGHFNYIAWVESKVKNKPLIGVLRASIKHNEDATK